jgi:IS5 family transposase
MGERDQLRSLRLVEPTPRRDLAVSKSLEHNRSLKMMKSIDKVVKWRDVEALLMEHYETWTSNEGADAYPALMLLKALLLQKWFRVPSDPELENQINDRISFKKFLGLPLDKPSPFQGVGPSRPEADHSTFSRFRNRLSEEAMRELNSLVLQEFSKRGLSINEGIAVDARLASGS